MPRGCWLRRDTRSAPARQRRTASAFPGRSAAPGPRRRTMALHRVRDVSPSRLARDSAPRSSPRKRGPRATMKTKVNGPGFPLARE
jgi:hypothetical protein